MTRWARDDPIERARARARAPGGRTPLACAQREVDLKLKNARAQERLDAIKRRPPSAPSGSTSNAQRSSVDVTEQRPSSARSSAEKDLVRENERIAARIQSARPRFASQSTIAALRGKSRPLSAGPRAPSSDGRNMFASDSEMQQISDEALAQRKSALQICKLVSALASAHKQKHGVMLITREVSVLGHKADVRVPSDVACWAANAALAELGGALDAIVRLPKERQRQAVRGLLGIEDLETHRRPARERR